MAEQFTTQDVIEMASLLYDSEGVTREEIHMILKTWQETGAWNASDAKLEKVFDMIVG